ncbi:AraC family transcriptional regulator [bacterium]|nr:AraC family transcriptional regulator [bacterium]
MQHIIQLVEKLATKEGYNQTPLSQVGVFKDSNPQGRAPYLYSQGIIFILQGKKKIYAENSVYEYNQRNYLVVAVPLPLECEPFIEEGKPLLGLTVNLDIPMLLNIIHLMGDSIDFNKFNVNEKDSGLYTSELSPELMDIIFRLVKLLQNPVETDILGDGVLRELIFQILKGEKAAPLYALTMRNTNLSKVEMALKEIHGNYDQSINVDSLAKIVNMSVSSFHHIFKDVTSSSPIQYIKKVRLDKARSFITENGLRVNEAARRVGYESVSQFSREFKRYYGVPPKDFVQG